MPNSAAAITANPSATSISVRVERAGRPDSGSAPKTAGVSASSARWTMSATVSDAGQTRDAGTLAWLDLAGPSMPNAAAAEWMIEPSIVRTWAMKACSSERSQPHRRLRLALRFVPPQLESFSYTAPRTPGEC